MKKGEEVLLTCLKEEEFRKVLNNAIREDAKFEEKFSHLLQTHRLIPYFFYKWSPFKDELRFSNVFWNKSEEVYKNNIKKNLLIFQELKILLHLFAQEKIEVILLKGVSLAERVYPHIGLRPMSDIDLLVKFKDVKMVKNILKRKDYKLLPQILQPEGERRGKLTYDSVKGIQLDLHWEIESFEPLKKYLPFNIDNLWENSRRVEMEGVPCSILSPEDEFIYLSLHLSYHHFFSQIIWLVDLKQILNTYQHSFRWDKMESLSSNLVLKKPLFLIFSYLRKVGMVLPEDILKRFKPKGMDIVECSIIKCLRSYFKNLGYILPLLLLSGVLLKIDFCQDFIKRKINIFG